ncbi:MAG: nucleotide exchange factor GrpE [Alphaproteobacteria bacterium]|nr:nucleotide exchange factor GrpE [Alphaproteobacteria bacterium]MBP9876975.1 nucleotide exchange factor GrpE [Alphaproteobacteria bacterium]
MSEENMNTEVQDISPPDDADNQEHTAPETIEPMHLAQMTEYQTKIADLNDQLLRSFAEVENIKKRAAKEKEDALKYGISKFAKELLSVSDNLGRALDSIPEGARQEDPALNNLYVGVEATLNQLIGAFEKMNIKEVSSIGEKFNPHFHQVVFEDEQSAEPAGTITQVLQKGYVIDDRLLREAMVGISKGQGK